MRIAILASLSHLDAEGGTERVTWAHAQGLRAAGHEVLLLAGRPAHETEDAQEVSRGVTILRLGTDPGCPPGPLGQRPELLTRLQEELLRFRPDRVVVQNHWNLDPRLVERCSRFAPVALWVHDFHGLCARSFRTPDQEGVVCPGRAELAAGDLSSCATCVGSLARGLGATRIEKLLHERLALAQAELRAAALLLFPSRTHLVRWSDLVDLGGKARIVHPGLCHDFPGEAAPPPAFHGGVPLRVLHHGRRSQEKGTLDLVRALGMLPRGTVELVAVGGAEPGFDERLRAAAPYLPMDLRGPYGAAQLEAVAATCHLAALPSRLPESYSLAVDEALALGLPVWAASADAARERHGVEGLRVLPSADPEAWAAALAEVIEEPQRLLAQCAAIPSDVPLAAAQCGRLAELLQAMGTGEERQAS